MRRHHMTKLFLGSLNAHIYSSHIGSPQQTKVQILSKFKLVNNFFFFKNWGYFQNQRWLRQLHHQSLPKHGWCAHRTRNLGHTIQPAGNSSGWKVSCPGAFVELNLFQVGLLVSDSSRQLFCSDSLQLSLPENFLCSLALLSGERLSALFCCLFWQGEAW